MTTIPQAIALFLALACGGGEEPRRLTMYDMHIQALVKQAAFSHGLPVALVEAVVTVESGGNPYAWNPEPAYRWLVDVRTGKPFRELTAYEAKSMYPPRDFHALAGDADQEFWGQQASWGLMQVMGAVAREHGFKGAYLTELCDPATNLEYGCKTLAALWDRYFARGGWQWVVWSYNAGNPKNPRGAAYADKILAALGGEWPGEG